MKLDDVEHEREMLEFEVDATLRKAGWSRSSNNPACMWLWSKKLADGSVVLVDKETAISFERHANSIYGVTASKKGWSKVTRP